MCKDDRSSLFQLLDDVRHGADQELAESPTPPSIGSSTPEPIQSSSASSGGAAASTAIFFARVPPVVSYEDLHALFSTYGAVQHLNLFRRWATAKTSKGCGIVQYSTVEEANSALQALNGIHSFDGFPGCEGPMVVEWMDPSRLTAPNDSTAGSSKSSKTSKDRSTASMIQGRLRSKASSSSQKGSQQQQQQHSQHLPKARAGAAAGTLGGKHPGLEALSDISTCLPCLGDVWGAPLTPAGLTDSSCNWSSNIPVHLLPDLFNQEQANLGCSSLPQLHPLVAPTTVAAAAAAAAAARAANPASARRSQLPLDASSASALGCPAASGLDGWLAAGLPSNTDSCSLGLIPQFTGFVPMTNPHLVAAQQQLQQQQKPLLLLKDAWATESSFDGYTTMTTNVVGAAADDSTSGSFSLFDSSALLPGLTGPTGAAAAAPARSSTPLFSSSSSIQSADAAGGLLGLFNHGVGSNIISHNNRAAAAAATAPHAMDGSYFAMLPSTGKALAGGSCSLSAPLASAAASEAAAADSQLLAQRETLQLDLCDSALCQLAGHIHTVARASGAELQINAGPSGMQLHMRGSSAQLGAACGLLNLLLSAGTA